MPLTHLGTRRYGSRLPVHAHLSRSFPVALALLLACAEGGDRPAAPLDRLHYPAWVALSGDQLLVVNGDQDLAYEGGSLLGLDSTSGEIRGGVALPYMSGRLRVVDASSATGCTFGEGYPLPFALVPGRSEDSVSFVDLGFPADASQARRRIDLRPFNAAHPYEAALTCGADGTPRAWVSYQRGIDDEGYVAQLDLSGPFPPPIVQVFTGEGPPRSFAWDAGHDRLYFTTRAQDLRAPIRWIGIGDGCEAFDEGVQEEQRGGCHVDAGFDLSSHLAGAEPNAIALSRDERPCTFTSGSCRRMYLTVRMYDADLARLLDARPAADVGGKLVILEVSESGLGGPEVWWIDDVDIGKIAGDVLAIPRPGRRDLVVATAVNDDLVWVYDDDRGTVAKIFGRLETGVPEVGHMPSGLASKDLGNGVARVFVASYEDHWVSAVDVPLDDPGDAYVVRDDADPRNVAAPYLRFGRPQ